MNKDFIDVIWTLWQQLKTEELQKAVLYALAFAAFLFFWIGYFVRVLIGWLRHRSAPAAEQPVSSPSPPPPAEDVARLKETVREAYSRLQVLEQKIKKYDKLRDALFGEEDELWRLRPMARPGLLDSRMKDHRPYVLTIANLKGGVGKTTLTANLAAHFVAQNKRVLLIDFDYQGSLTRTVLLAAGKEGDKAILASEILSGVVEARSALRDTRGHVPTIFPHSHFITCGQKFDGFENRLMLKWLMEEVAEDVRFRLADFLVSDDVRGKFDLVLIDAPPRLSTGALNAFCASHAVLIPTVLDRMSADAVGNFVDRLNPLRTYNPWLNYVGVVGTFVEDNELKDYEKAAISVAKSGLADWSGTHKHFFSASIRDTPYLARAAGQHIGYMKHQYVRDMFNTLGCEIGKEFNI